MKDKFLGCQWETQAGLAFPDLLAKWVGWVWEHGYSRSTCQKQRDEIKDGQEGEASSFHPLRKEWAEQKKGGGGV